MVAATGVLTALDLSSNNLKDEGVSAVCEAIQSNKETKLMSLNFGNNEIGPVGANAVAAMVAVTGVLTTIDLSDNLLCGVWDDDCGDNYTAEGITAIADALRVNGSLTSLDLSKNQLCGLNVYGDGTYNADGITAIADALRVNGSLTKMRYVTFRSAPSSHILRLTLPTALCNLTTRPLLPSVTLCLCAALTTTASMRKPSKPSETLGGAPPPNWSSERGGMRAIQAAQCAQLYTERRARSSSNRRASS